jgi:hypothetical protein
LLIGDAFGRQLDCQYSTHSDSLWPSSFRQCYTHQIDYSAKFETEKHSFSHSGKKSRVKKKIQTTIKTIQNQLCIAMAN